jgi:hypothetical protein
MSRTFTYEQINNIGKIDIGDVVINNGKRYKVVSTELSGGINTPLTAKYTAELEGTQPFSWPLTINDEGYYNDFDPFTPRRVEIYKLLDMYHFIETAEETPEEITEETRHKFIKLLE